MRSAFELREFEAWVHSCRVMLGDENCVDDFGLSMFETVPKFNLFYSILAVKHICITLARSLVRELCV